VSEDSDVATQVAAPASTSHPIGFWFFFWGEFAERCSYYGMRAILALYMTERLGIDKGDAGTFMSLFIAACYFFPLIGGWVADNYLGKYWTIVLFAVPYVVAQFLVGMENRYVVFGALVLLAMGSGVIKPNISTLMGLTYDQQRPGQEQLRTSAFSWFYMSINIGAALSQFSMPWLRDEYGYQVAFLFPAGLMTLALLIFGAGKKYYAVEKIERTVVGRPEDLPADDRTVTGLPVTYKAVSFEEKAAERRLKFQTLGRIASVFLTVMFFWAIFDQSASTWIFFADTYMDTTLAGTDTAGNAVLLSGETANDLTGSPSFRMRADAIQAFNPVFIVLLVPLSVALFKVVPVRATTKMVIGFALTGLSMVIMSYAGSMAGQSQKAVKVTFPEGALVLPMTDTPLDKVTGKEVTFGKEVKVTAGGFEFNDTNNQLSFATGRVELSNGKAVEVTDGHLSAATVADPAALTAGGVLEPVLKTGKAAAKVDPKPAKATMEVIDWTKPQDRVTVWWQVLAFLVITIAEVLISITGLELAFVAAPASMKSFVTACWLAVVFLANLLINAPITQLYPLMSPVTYFAMLAGAMGVVVVVFLPIAARFNRGMAAAPPT
jgi:POT family proton-dependent oligopeptide transporter